MSMANALNDTCDRIGEVENPTADEADLLQACADIRNGGNTPEQVAAALQALNTEETTQTIDALLFFTIPQHGNLSQRINGMRSGSDPLNVSGLNLMWDNHQIASADLDRFLKSLLGGVAGSEDGFGRWSFFGNGNINRSERDATINGGGFDADTMSLSFGGDYRLNDNLIVGASINYSDVDADFNDGGDMQLESWAGSVFGSFFTSDKFYVDGILTYGKDDLDITRVIQYTTVFGSTSRVASSKPEGDQISFNIGFGYDFTPGKWIIGPHGGVNFRELTVDSYTETGAMGLDLNVGEQTTESLSANLGVHVSYTFTPSWGVVVPYLRGDYLSEFRDSSETVSAHFASDRFAFDPTDPTQSVIVRTDEVDKSYFVYSVGVSVQMIRGVAGFINYRATQGLDDFDVNDVTVGLRLESTF